jgi:hypothetical protein
MPAHARMRAAAVGRQATLPIYRWTGLAAGLALASLIEACTACAFGRSRSGRSANPRARRRLSFTGRTLCEPAAGRAVAMAEQNDRLAPSPKP